MITAKVQRPVQRADKRGQVPGKPRDVITAPASILNPPVIGHDRSLPPRSQRVSAVMADVAKQRPQPSTARAAIGLARR